MTSPFFEIAGRRFMLSSVVSWKGDRRWTHVLLSNGTALEVECSVEAFDSAVREAAKEGKS